LCAILVFARGRGRRVHVHPANSQTSSPPLLDLLGTDSGAGSASVDLLPMAKAVAMATLPDETFMPLARSKPTSFVLRLRSESSAYPKNSSRKLRSGLDSLVHLLWRIMRCASNRVSLRSYGGGYRGRCLVIRCDHERAAINRKLDSSGTSLIRRGRRPEGYVGDTQPGPADFKPAPRHAGKFFPNAHLILIT